MKVMIRYYHTDGGNTLDTLVSLEALEVFIKAILSCGYVILEII